MFEKRRVGAKVWEKITAHEALSIIHGEPYQFAYVRVRLPVDANAPTDSGSPPYAISKNPIMIEYMANDAINPSKLPFTGYSVSNLGNGVLHHAEDLPCAEPWGN